MDKLYIIIPAYNEKENIRQVIDDWYPVVEAHNASGKSRLVVIDDGSKDNTYAILKEYAKRRPLLCPVTKVNGGMEPQFFMEIGMLWKNKQTIFFRQIRMVKRHRMSLSNFGICGKAMIW